MPIAACLLFLAGCGDEEAIVTDATSDVPAFDFTFDHPSDLELQSEIDGVVQYCFASELEARSTRCLWFSVDGDMAASDQTQTAELASGGSLTYAVTSKTVGSGGTEHSLTGMVLLDSDSSGADAIYVTANASEDAGHGDATWAVPVLQTIRR